MRANTAGSIGNGTLGFYRFQAIRVISLALSTQLRRRMIQCEYYYSSRVNWKQRDP